MYVGVAVHLVSEHTAEAVSRCGRRCCCQSTQQRLYLGVAGHVLSEHTAGTGSRCGHRCACQSTQQGLYLGVPVHVLSEHTAETVSRCSCASFSSWRGSRQMFGEEIEHRVQQARAYTPAVPVIRLQVPHTWVLVGYPQVHATVQQALFAVPSGAHGGQDQRKMDTGSRQGLGTSSS